MKRILFLAFLLVGCNEVKELPKAMPEYSDKEKAVADSMSELSIDDSKTAYKLFVGVSEYLKNTETKTKLSDFTEVAIPKFNSDYKWESKSAKFSNATEKFLRDSGYDEDKNVVSEVKDASKEVEESKVVSDFETLAHGAKLAIESKVAEKEAKEAKDKAEKK